MNILKRVYIPDLVILFSVIVLYWCDGINLILGSELLLLVLLNVCYKEQIYQNDLRLKQETDEKKETYVATIVHDLKNPLIGQNRILENLIRKNFLPEYNDLLKTLLSSSKLMLEMVMSILNTYKYENGNIKYNFEKINIVDLISESCSEIVGLTDNENNLQLQINSSNPIVYGDRLHLMRVVTNLISNAVKYKQENSEVFIEVNSNSNKCEFLVTNQGHYISPEYQEKLFDKYVSKSVKFKNSTGLGLYLSKKIINDHNGRIIVHSKKEGLNTFGFAIPIQKELLENNNQQGNSLHQKGVSKTSALYRI